MRTARLMGRVIDEGEGDGERKLGHGRLKQLLSMCVMSRVELSNGFDLEIRARNSALLNRDTLLAVVECRSTSMLSIGCH